ncbi:hypothetical protein [Aquamicrobium defluvii]|uniref:Uncharacterized protein n=1 Tax=Aquamicrobium defluvii TaxID=69279 RepID=A0A011TI04_9HYPH|nr:hypothetical protein [Aquamicrobium defluvii]EXL03617.1 hypothetical protein BG36_11445 [Aquamicrobium defluvii]EZQ15272.1 hypothetical protein CF98_12755 [Halopseudomonas bauzanensis]TDR32097.1 hypothetical protein DES43_12938 [Aquamicrobium defluvii]
MTSQDHFADGSIRIVEDDVQGRIVTFDSATFVNDFYGDTLASKDVIAAASYSGVLCARMVARHQPRGVIGLDCAIGKDGAGIAGLAFYEALGIPSAAVDVMTAEMGNGNDLYTSGIISRVNDRATSLGLNPGMSAREAASILKAADDLCDDRFADQENRETIYTNAAGRSIVCTDSIAFWRPEDTGRNVLCTAGHTGRSVIDYIVGSGVWGFICSDGGIGKNESGIAALPAADDAGIAGASVSALSARMGDGHSTYYDGVISACNELARSKGVQKGMSAIEAARLLVDN